MSFSRPLPSLYPANAENAVVRYSPADADPNMALVHDSQSLYNLISPLFYEPSMSDLHTFNIPGERPLYCIDQALGVSLWNILNQIARIITRAGTIAQAHLTDDHFVQLGLPRPRVLAVIDVRVFNVLYTYAPLGYIYSVWKDLQAIGREGIEWIRMAKLRQLNLGTEMWDWNVSTGTLRETLIREHEMWGQQHTAFFYDATHDRSMTTTDPRRRHGHDNPDIDHALHEGLAAMTLNDGRGRLAIEDTSHLTSSDSGDSDIDCDGPESDNHPSDDYSIASDYEDIVHDRRMSRSVVLHPEVSTYARRYPAYNVFSGQVLANNGYITDDNDSIMQDA